MMAALLKMTRQHAAHLAAAAGQHNAQWARGAAGRIPANNIHGLSYSVYAPIAAWAQVPACPCEGCLESGRIGIHPPPIGPDHVNDQPDDQHHRDQRPE